MKRFIVCTVLLLMVLSMMFCTVSCAEQPDPDSCVEEQETKSPTCDSEDIAEVPDSPAQPEPPEESTIDFEGIYNNQKHPAIYKSLDSRMLDTLRGIYGDDTRFVFLNSKDITEEMLIERVGSGVVLVERALGVVIDKDGSGMLVNCDPIYNYISYSNIGFNPSISDMVLTYLVYNPDTTYTDDIIERYDFPFDFNDGF